MNLRLTEVVKNLLIINILFFIGSYVILGEPARLLLAMFFPGAPSMGDVIAFGQPFELAFKPFQIVTHMFMHGGMWHILFNMMVLVFFGPPIEALWGPKRFLFFYFVAGFGALGLHLLVQWIEVNYYGADTFPMLGASGAMMGVLVAFGFNYPNHTVYLLIPPIPLKAKYMVVLIIAMDLFMGFSPFDTGIANFAHLGGAFTGIFLILYWRKFGTKL